MAVCRIFLSFFLVLCTTSIPLFHLLHLWFPVSSGYFSFIYQILLSLIFFHFFPRTSSTSYFFSTSPCCIHRFLLLVVYFSRLYLALCSMLLHPPSFSFIFFHVPSRLLFSFSFPSLSSPPLPALAVSCYFQPTLPRRTT